jgi:hypothetical protein
MAIHGVLSMIHTLSRRKLLGGLGLLIAAPAIVKASSLMPVKAYAAVPEVEYWAQGIRYQTWPYGRSPRPEEWVQGTMETHKNRVKPMEHWMNELRRIQTVHPSVYWEPIGKTEFVCAIAAEPLHAGQPVVLR